MKLITVTGLFLLLGATLFADDPCNALGIAGTWQSSGIGGGTCTTHNQFGVVTAVVNVSDADLVARIINNQKDEIVALKAAIDGLTKAVASLESTSKSLVAADQKWQTDTLSKTIAAVDKVPATLAAEKSLQDVLVAAIKAQLLKDPTFLEAVKKAP